VIAVVAVGALVGQAVRGNRTVGAQLATTTVHDAHVDNAFYRCLDVQTRSLVSPGQTVAFGAGDLGDLVTLLKAVGSWVTVSDQPGRASVELSLRTMTGAGTCLGTVVVARTRGPGGRVTVRMGTGDQVNGHGPPPAPPL